jgi:hypothetical protein
MAIVFDEMVFDQVVDSIRMAFDEVVGRPKNLRNLNKKNSNMNLPFFEWISEMVFS